MKITMIIGEPATGKSTAVKAIMAGFDSEFRAVKYIPHHYIPFLDTSLAILGKYDESQFPGTDKMSMACQPHVLKWLATEPYNSILFEGDRLGNLSMIHSLLKMNNVDLMIIQLHCQYNHLEHRRSDRFQSKQFLCSRATKIANISKELLTLKIPCLRHEHTFPEHTQKLRAYILANRL